MKRAFIALFVLILNLFYCLIKLLPTNKNKVTMISRETDTESLDFRMLKKSLEEKGVKVVTLCKVLRNKFAYAPHLFTQMYHIATSKVVIVDTYCIPISILRHKKDLKVIQMWHAAAAVKQFGLQLVDRLAGVEESVASGMHMHTNYDYVLAPSKVTGKNFCEAFGFREEQLVYIALPRLQYISEKNPEVIREIEERYPMLRNGNKTIFYAPTFRYNASIMPGDLLNRIDTDRYNVIIKTHPFDAHIYSEYEKDNVVVDDEFDTYDILKVADILISDYSSLLVEATIRDIPIYLYVYDFKEYRLRTGLNMDFENEAIGKYTFESGEELAKALDKDYDMEALRKFRSKYIEVNYHNAVGRLTMFISSLMRN